MTTRLVRPPRLLGFGGRPYNFYEREALPQGLAAVLPGRFSAVLLVEGALVFADDTGHVTFTDGDLNVSLQHRLLEPASPCPVLLARSRQSPPLMAAAGSDAGGSVVIKTWVGAKVAAPSNVIDVGAQLRAAAGAGGGDGSSSKLEVTALACNHDGTKLVAGFRSGLVLLLEGDFGKDRAKVKPPTILRPAVPGGRAVSGLHFMQPSEGPATTTTSSSSKAPVPPAAAAAAAAAAANLHKLYVVMDTAATTSNTSSSADPTTTAAGAASSPSPSPSIGGGGGGGGILVFNTAELGRPGVLDDEGASPGCAGVDPTTQDLVVGRPDAMYFYSEEEGRKGALGFEVRQRLCPLGGAGGPSSAVLAATTEEVGVGATGSRGAAAARTSLAVYDLRNKFVAFSGNLPAGHVAAGMVAEGGLAYVVTDQGMVLRLREREIGAKIKLLVEDMKLFGVAIKLAYSSNYDVGRIMEIYKRYGDYLYEKKRAYDEAVKQYIHTIGYLDPSYVIARFLDAQRIRQLTAYLEALHRKGHATAELTTFLLNCYVKLRDAERLDQLICPEKYLEKEEDLAALALRLDGEDEEEEDEEEEVVEGEGQQQRQQRQGQRRRRRTFLPAGLALLPPAAGEEEAAAAAAAAAAEGSDDAVNTAASGRGARRRSGHVDVDAAVSVLRGAGYLDLALELARKYKAHEWYLRIQLEKPSPSYRDALTYISTLPFADAAALVRRHGRRLLAALPEEATGVIMALCTGRFALAAAGGGGRPMKTGTVGTAGAGAGAGAGAYAEPPSDKANAEDFVHLFVDHPQWLRTFLSCVMREPGLQVSPSVADGLLELLVQDWAAAAAAAASDAEGGSGSKERRLLRRQREAELMAFLEQHHGRYDEDQALVLVQVHGFKPGQLFLYDKARSVELVLDHYMAEGDAQAVISRMGRKENRKNPDLWLKVLTYVVDAARPRGGQGGQGQQQQRPQRQQSGRRRRRRRRGRKGQQSDSESSSSSGSEDSDGSEGEEEDEWEDVTRVLQMVEKEQALPPHTIVEVLSRNPHLPLSVVRPYLGRLLKEAYADVSASQGRIDALRRSTTEKRAEVEDLRSTARLFQTTTCSSCRRPLELPAVHFLCMHSYHLDSSCLAREGECNECAAEHRHYERIKLRDQSGRALGEQEHFFSELEEHGFAAVAAYFGKGVLNVDPEEGGGGGGGMGGGGGRGRGGGGGAAAGLWDA